VTSLKCQQRVITSEMCCVRSRKLTETITSHHTHPHPTAHFYVSLTTELSKLNDPTLQKGEDKNTSRYTSSRSWASRTSPWRWT